VNIYDEEGGMTSQFMIFIKQLIALGYDVTVFATMQDTIASEKLDELSRLFTPVIPFSADMTEENSVAMTREEQKILDYAIKYGFSKRITEKAARKAAGKLAQKYFSDIQFDCAIDYVGGVSALHMCALLEVPAKRKYIWLHTDYQRAWEYNYKDVEKTLRPDTKIFRQLFKRYDKIVSVGKTISRINAQSFATPKTQKKFTYVTNFIDIDRLKLSSPPPAPDLDGTVKIKEERWPNGMKRATYLPKKRRVRFCYVGRLHPEKNVANIINACGILKKRGFNFEMIIAGKDSTDPYHHTDYEKYLISLIDINEVAENVIMTGFLQSPGDLMKLSDCLLIVSLYEGASLTAQEARAIGIPIIFSHFESRIDIMVPNGQIVVMADAECIAEGMIEFIERGSELKYEWDPHTHNRMALEELKKLMDKI
jgi:glycosyltransferase involved in cell wall biosynthesis